jgi:hypothetical protein
MLAKIVQVLGPVSGAAGTSSGAISMFILDAMQANPVVVECPTANDGRRTVCCGLDEQKARLSFLLKSLTGIKSGLFWAEDILAIIETFRIRNILGLLRSKSNAVAQDALTVLLSILQAAVVTTDNNESLINPEFLQTILTSSNPIAAAIDLVSATFALQTILGSGTAAADEPKVFVRPGLVNFRRVAQIADLVACFYRGLHPVDLAAMRSIVDDCAMRSVALSSWAEIANLPTAHGSSCGDRFDKLFRQFQLVRGDTTYAPSMLQDPVGGKGMKLMGHSSVLTGRAVQIWQDAREAYRARPDASITFGVDFDDVKIGFYGQDEYMDVVEQRMLGGTEFTDIDSQKFLNLGAATWDELLLSSMSEPGLARGIEDSTGMLVTLGGFSHQMPVLVLEALGCDKIIMVNRPEGDDETNSFRYVLNRMLGASDEELALKYDVENPESTVAQALRRHGLRQMGRPRCP